MIMILVYAVVFLIALAIVYWIIQLIPFPPGPFKNIVLALVLLIGLLIFLGMIFGWWGPPRRIWLR
jgi:hypothetical protein